MGYPLKKESEKKFTRADYLTWPEDERWEIIDGEAHCMTPAPSIRHQDIVVNLATRLKQKLGGGPCRTLVAPTDVVLSEYDVVQPDILVVCDKKKITDANIQGAPDLIIEVLSPYTSLKDKREKKALYERFGVREYIIVDPLEQYVERFLFEDDDTYGKGEVFGPQEILRIKPLEGIDISLREVLRLMGQKR
ncbi:MAG: Uma2 family endonuclease [Planctomycetes bacterium]|nr:Uma2 family endonuclease [Planctomycetota bacterium]